MGRAAAASLNAKQASASRDLPRGTVQGPLVHPQVSRRPVLHGAGLPAAVVVAPFFAEAVRTAFAGRIWLWGDQALIDIEARDTLAGHNLLGVYDRYGWHHLGPIWLWLLGLARWLGGGSVLSLVVGSYAIQAAAAAAIIVVAWRVRPGKSVWWAALAVLGFEWSFGLYRLGTVWAPYAIALPTALLVLLVADVASNPNPWPAAIGAVACASFLCQTEISSAMMSVALLVAVPFLRLASQSLVETGSPGHKPRRRPRLWLAHWKKPASWGWSTPGWRLGAAGLVGVGAVCWAPTLAQQVNGNPGNLSLVFDFFTSHSGHQSFSKALSALNTVFGSFPFGLGVQDGDRDSTPAWLFVHSPWARPWYLSYLLLLGVLVGAAVVLRQRRGFALALTSALALVAAGLSVPAVYGRLYPYLIVWESALLIPVWVSAWWVLAPVGTSCHERLRGAGAKPAVARLLGNKRSLPVATFSVAAAVGVAFAVSAVPMAGKPSHLGKSSWDAVASALLAPGVRTVYIDMANADAMPEAAAIADESVRHGIRVELDPAALRFVDPSLAATRVPQLEVIVCCNLHDRQRTLAGAYWRGKVGGEQIYTTRFVTVDSEGLAKANEAKGLAKSELVKPLFRARTAEVGPLPRARPE